MHASLSMYDLWGAYKPPEKLLKVGKVSNMI